METGPDNIFQKKNRKYWINGSALKTNANLLRKAQNQQKNQEKASIFLVCE